MNYLIMFCSAIVFLLAFFIFLDKNKKHISVFYKVISLSLAALFIVWYLLAKPNILENTFLKFDNPFKSEFLCFVTGLGCWLLFSTTVVLELLPFFKFGAIKNLAKTYCLVASALVAVLLNQVVFSFTNSAALTVTGVLIDIHVGLLLAYSLHYCIVNRGFFVPKKELVELFVGIFIAMFFSVPPYMPKLFFGNAGINYILDLKIFHRIYIYISLIMIFGLYFLLRNKEREYSRMVLLYISLVTLISYCHTYTYSIFVTPTNWPLHLCNTAMFILPICLLFKFEWLFYFTLFINVVGAFFAMLMPNYSAIYSAFSTPVVNFWINHIMAFAMPVLIIMLGVYPRPKLKHFLYSLLVFSIYFLLVLFLNAWFSNFNKGVDFFFLNSDFIVKKLGKWAENTRNIRWSFTVKGMHFTFYPLYQGLFFVVYLFLGLLVWFLFSWLFGAQDFYKDLREKNRKIKLDEIILTTKYGKKTVEECMNEESKGKLVLKNIRKRYGSSKVDVVKNINIEVGEGEIIGFLGLNGAGKSTIIKCIVGIQPATEGTIEINGYDIEKQPVQAKQQFGFVPDHYALYENLTGREYVNYIADLYDVSKEDRDARLKKLLKNLNMAESFDSQIKTYSHGMKQKIAIMSALIHNPKLWILDEPLTGLDPISIYQVKECMRQHAKQKNIVFFSSHIIDIVEKLCTRIIIINKHEIVTDIKLEEIQDMGISLEDFYLTTIGEKIEK